MKYRYIGCHGTAIDKVGGSFLMDARHSWLSTCCLLHRNRASNIWMMLLAAGNEGLLCVNPVPLAYLQFRDDISLTTVPQSDVDVSD